MQVTINHRPHTLPDGATVADAVAALNPPPPFAVALNLAFVPRTTYASRPLAEGDTLEIIAPVTGG